MGVSEVEGTQRVDGALTGMARLWKPVENWEEKMNSSAPIACGTWLLPLAEKGDSIGACPCHGDSTS
jgi:hypothetical protein